MINSLNVRIIGGADGPTAIFVGGSVLPLVLKGAVLLGGLALMVAYLIYLGKK